MINTAKKLICCLILMTAGNALAKAYNIQEYGISIAPDERCVQNITRLNADLARQNLQFDNSYNNWNVVLYHGAFEPHALKKIAHKLIDIKAKPFDLVFNEIESTVYGTVNFNIEKTPDLQRLHEKVVSIAKKYHVKLLDKARDKYNTMPKHKRNQADEYGLSGVMEHYKPHVTLLYSDAPQKDLDKITKNMAKIHNHSLICKAAALTINEISYDGRVVKTIETVSLEDY